ncbi:MAG: alpha/beta fold hydrolase [Chloroflexota bacterium]|nr:alpha/beta fold hydrolase [Dehalococcoidia bacterium]MDW8252376.1 alpha/beta fold hydrolase [Chloroflexota bacterium]
MTIRRGFVETRFGQIHYLTAGAGEPLILLHQSPQSSAMFRPIIPLLAVERRVVALDTLGYGNSAPPVGRATIPLYADAVSEAIAKLGFERAAVHGYHTGAAIAIDLAARAPAQVNALILGGIPYFDERERAQRLEALRAGRFGTPPAAEDGSHLQTLFSLSLKREGDPGEATRDVIERLQLGERALAGFEAAFTYDMSATLPAVRCPTLVLVGRDDEIYRNTLAARALLGPHRFVETAGGRRFRDTVDRWAAEMLAFLRTV